MGRLPQEATRWLIVDTTSTRVRSTSVAHYSGYKHHRCSKVQVIVADSGMVLDVSAAYPGSVHDKAIWDRELPRVRPLLTCPTLGDKAYAGGSGERETLFRPVRRNETAWKRDNEASRSFNRRLSSVRVRVEHAFARIKSFRVLAGQFPLGVDRYACAFAAVAFVCYIRLDRAVC